MSFVSFLGSFMSDMQYQSWGSYQATQKGRSRASLRARGIEPDKSWGYQRAKVRKHARRILSGKRDFRLESRLLRGL